MSVTLDLISEHGLHLDFMNYSYDQLEQLEHDTELLGSANII